MPDLPTPHADQSNNPPHRQAGLDRLQSFLPRASTDYRRLRNYDFGPQNRYNVSILSPYIRNRLISEVEVAQTIRDRFSYASAEKFIDEVFWRTYWKGFLENRPNLWSRYRSELSRLLSDHQNSTTLESAQRGSTGIDCFDVWVNELRETGYLHNHTRMWFASIWIHTLKLPWQIGADFFLRHLIDGDPASNTLSWRWVAGLHTKGKTYLATSSNIIRYSADRFVPPTGLADQATPLAHPLELPTPKLTSIPHHPLEIPAHSGLLILEEDLCDHMLPSVNRFETVLGLFPADAYGEHSSSQRVQDFRRSSLLSRLNFLETDLKISACFAEADLASALLSWATENRLQRVYLAQPQVGIWSEHWLELQATLTRTGIEVHRFRHWWENWLFPYTNGSFFKFKKQLPRFLAELQNRQTQQT